MGNPCLDSIDAFLKQYNGTRREFTESNGLSDKPIVALLAGSRKQEIESNLPMMLEAMKNYPEYQPVIAGAPGIDAEFYAKFLKSGEKIIYAQTYPLLKWAYAALVTSGTATLETAIFTVPQVVCYATPMPKLYSWLKRNFLKVKFVSLVNLIAGREVVKELVAADMTVANVSAEIGKLLGDSRERTTMLEEYKRNLDILGEAGASEHAAAMMVRMLGKK